MIIDNLLLDQLSAKAKTSPRLRMNYDLRNNENDNSQRMLNAMEPGTVLPIHRHMASTETFVVLRGSLRELYYDDKGQVTESVLLQAQGPQSGISIPAGQWHSAECLESGTVILVCKDGKYEPQREEDLLKNVVLPVKQDILDYLESEARSMQYEQVSSQMLLYHLGEGVTYETMCAAAHELAAEGKVRISEHGDDFTLSLR